MGLPLPSEAKIEADKRFAELEAWLKSRKDLINSSHAFRSLHIIILATRGAIQFDDLDELSELCAAFCDEKAKDMTGSN